MDVVDLAKTLDLFYEIGKERKERNALVQCFGIKYAEFILAHNIIPEDIIELSSLKGSQYAIELRKGIKLAKYVCLKDNVIIQ